MDDVLGHTHTVTEIGPRRLNVRLVLTGTEDPDDEHRAVRHVHRVDHNVTRDDQSAGARDLILRTKKWRIREPVDGSDQ